MRDILKRSMNVDKEMKLLRGVSAGDVWELMNNVVLWNRERGVNLRFTWKAIQFKRGFTVERLMKRILKKSGKYILFGKAKRANGEHKALMKQILASEEEDKLNAYGKVADKCKRGDHGMSVLVRDDLTATCFNNSYVTGEALYSVEAMAGHMIGINECFVIELCLE